MFECPEILVCELPLHMVHLLLKATCTLRILSIILSVPLRKGFRLYTSHTRTNTIVLY